MATQVYIGRSVHDMDPGLMYKAISQKEVDVICAFATDGRIPAYGLKPLEDDKGFFPPYYAAPVVRQEVLESQPEVCDALKPLGALLDDKTMQRLNHKVDEEKQSPAQAAKEFLKAKGLIESQVK